MDNEKTFTNIFKYELFGLAYFEDRRFEKAFCKSYIFIYKSYLVTHFPNLEMMINEYCQKEEPQTLNQESRSLLIQLTEIKELVSISNFNLILIELIKKANSFEQINIIFLYLIEYNHFEKMAINEILNLCLVKPTIRGAFEAQKNILNLILKNINLIEIQLVEKLLDNFPHDFQIIFESQKIRHQALIDDINLELIKKRSELESENSNKPNIIKSSYTYYNRNLEIEEGENELRRWDEEDPSWRIANDLD
jgi:hypothetical protein